MPNHGIEQRKLAAIMFTDMVGYSALAQRNEKLALELLGEQECLLRALFPKFGGHEIKSIGDGFLVEFSSALAAMECAIEVQRVLFGYNAAVLPERQFQVRIGVHLGDVVLREADIFGDGVNIAARIEPLAEAGGICLSGPVYDQVANKLEAPLVKVRAPELKNIRMSMDVYRVVLPWSTGPEKQPVPKRPVPRRQGAKRRKTSSKRLLLLAGMGVILIGVFSPVFRQGTGIFSNSPLPVAAGPLRIESIAVKPFDDFSGDTNQAYLSDGMTEALCAALGNIHALRVPGRSSVMRYKGTRKSIPEMARELKVDAIIEGSIQRTTNRLLLTVQLIQAATDRHLWSTNYEHDLAEFFRMQSEVTSAIANEIQVRLTLEDQARLARARAANPDAIEACLLGMHHWWHWSDEGMTNALRYFQKAIAIDSNYAPAHAGAALAYGQGAIWWLWPPREVMPRSMQAAKRAIELDPMLANAYVARGYVRLEYDWDWSGAEKDFKHAMELSLNSSLALDGYANLLVARGRFDEAIVILKQALELDLLSPALHTDLGWAYHFSGKFDQANLALHKALELERDYVQAHYWLGWNYQYMGKTSEALAEFQALSRGDPESADAKRSLGYAWGVAGRSAAALQVLTELDELAKRRYVPSFARASVYLGLGQKDVALDWFEKAYEEREGEMVFLKLDPALISLRNEPRFKALVKKVENGGVEK